MMTPGKTGEKGKREKGEKGREPSDSPLPLPAGGEDPPPAKAGKSRQPAGKKKARKKAQPGRGGSARRKQCGLCGKKKKLTRTECCGQWICDDDDSYMLFSSAHHSCLGNHRRYTLCAHHHAHGHPGKWQECPQCRADFETELFVEYGTNEYNFERLENPPAAGPAQCADCGKVISLDEGGYSRRGGKYFCRQCTFRRLSEAPRRSPHSD